ncbi:MAG: hypothetical protein GWN51_16870 [Gemmatimonadetes bacterium]|nr:hypothetical protein [Gemmatimonadota bacterium]NIT68612.1 hypothetical protein [Gemmatimonadota bacterium]NIV25304.1 hypothetical protein [Gemmatimonadota bacterium]NIW77328.1 hypothetical protein [Gemmatimonadota bacterium]NIY37189.1 hypothetical protein [Gemmatimonadota bacterium]
MEKALGLVDAICAAGLVLVPAEPTTAMLAAGADAGGLAPDAARRVFRAMIEAA